MQYFWRKRLPLPWQLIPCTLHQTICFHHHTLKIPNVRTGVLHCLRPLDLQGNSSGFRPRKLKFLWCLLRTLWIWVLRTWTRSSAFLYVATSCGTVIRSFLRHSAQCFFSNNFWCSESTGACYNVGVNIPMLVSAAVPLGSQKHGFWFWIIHSPSLLHTVHGYCMLDIFLFDWTRRKAHRWAFSPSL